MLKDDLPQMEEWKTQRALLPSRWSEPVITHLVRSTEYPSSQKHLLLMPNAEGLTWVWRLDMTVDLSIRGPLSAALIKMSLNREAVRFFRGRGVKNKRKGEEKSIGGIGGENNLEGWFPDQGVLGPRALIAVGGKACF